MSCDPPDANRCVSDSAPSRRFNEVMLREDGIQTRIHYRPIHLFKGFKDVEPDTSLPITEDFPPRELTLPLYPFMTESHVDTIVSAVVQCRLQSIRRGLQF